MYSLPTSLYGNSTNDLIYSVGLLAGIFFISIGLRVLLIKYLEKVTKSTVNMFDDFLLEYINSIHRGFFFILALFISLRFLKTPPYISTYVYYTFMVLVVFYGVRAATKIVNMGVMRQCEKNKDHDNSMVPIMGLMIKAILWLVATLLILSNLGVNITSLVAGLGVGGIAIAFGLQTILADLFASFSIFFDKPFVKGDFIIIGQDMGVVENVGLKSTRIKTLQGQELVVSNRELTSVRINNYKKMEKRRVAFNFGVEYSTSVKKLEKIPRIVSKILKKIKLTNLDRVNFKQFGPSSLDYEVVYYLDSSNYKEYMDIQEKINLNIVDQFKKARISMAFPTTTVHLKK